MLNQFVQAQSSATHDDTTIRYGVTGRTMTMLKSRIRFGKYVIEKKLGEGGFAVVYQARDTIEGIRVALKIPYPNLVTGASLETFRQEVRLAAKLEHPNIQPLKYADFIDGHFVIVTSLGQGTLEERLRKRLSAQTALRFSAQILEAVAFAHENKIIHCDVKPGNLLLFPDNQLRLTDFGIARVAHQTLKGSGAGTVGFVAPEQAMGKPSFRSDVFSIGLILYRMFTGKLPEWPYAWPFPGYERLRNGIHTDLIRLIRKSTQVEARYRYKDAIQMLAAFERVRYPLTKGQRSTEPTGNRRVNNWRAVRYREFQKHFGRVLETRHHCARCSGPVAEVMSCCPWCGKSRKKHSGDTTRFSVQCPRCHRGMKSDWRYCAWCYGAGFEPYSSRKLSDRRYEGRCGNSDCERKRLMPFMRYCPWCNIRVRRNWKLKGSKDACGGCGWGIAREYWSYCPWCTKKV